MFDIMTFKALLETFGFGVAQTSLVVFLLWKIATNHLKHIADDIKNVAKDVKNLSDKIEGMKSHCILEGERLAKLEGKIEL